MKISMLTSILANVAMAQIRFIPTHPGPNTPAKPILGAVNDGLADTINQISVINSGVGYASQRYHSYAPSVMYAYLQIYLTAGLNTIAAN